MNRQINVFLGASGQRIGTLFFNAAGNRESGGFEYADTWLAWPGHFQIDPALPLNRGRLFRSKVKDSSPFHGAIADTEADGWGQRVIMRDHAKRRQQAQGKSAALAEEPPTSLDLLLAVDDFSRVGALRFQDERGVFQRAPEKGRRTAPPLIELERLLRATRAVENASETTDDLEYLRGRATSLGGMRPKCTVLDNNGALAIGKFPSIHDRYSVTKGEVLALRIASAAGIDASEARIIKSDGVPVALIRRFDRVADGGRIPYVSAATLLGVKNTYEHHAYTQIVDALLQYSADSRADAEELWRRIALSVLINNVDDHLRNHGFLHVEQGKWRLSPAFDINPFPDKSRALKTWISESSGDAASIEALMAVLPYFGIALARARELLKKVEAAVARWRVIGAHIGMTKKELSAFESAFEHPERELARRIARAGAKVSANQ